MKTYATLKVSLSLFFVCLMSLLVPSTTIAGSAERELPPIKFSVFYEIDAPWNEAANISEMEPHDSELAGVIESFGLHIMGYNDLDEETRILELRPDFELGSPVEVACKLSLIDHIIMVHIEHIPQTEE